MRRATIRRIQTFLQHEGLYSGLIDGIYGKGTKTAVKQFQKAHNLVVDGIAGRKTRYVMFGDKLFDRVYTSKVTSYIPDNTVCHSKYPHEIPHSNNQSELISFYGRAGKGNSEVARALRKYTFPYTMYYGDIPVTSVYLHKKAGDSFMHFFEDIRDSLGMKWIEEHNLNKYAGAYNPRLMRGANRWSIHAFGAAMDLDAGRNRLRWHKPKAEFSNFDIYALMFRIAEKHGLYNLGINHDYDYMHFQAAWRV